mgnify:CR=1 FL=1
MNLENIKKIESNIETVKNDIINLEEKLAKKALEKLSKKENFKNCFLFIIALGISFSLFALLGIATSVIRVFESSFTIIFNLKVNIYLFFAIITLLGSLIGVLVKTFLLKEYFNSISKKKAEEELKKRKVVYKYSSNNDRKQLDKLYDKLEILVNRKNDYMEGKIKGDKSIENTREFVKMRKRNYSNLSVLPDDEEN